MSETAPEVEVRPVTTNAPVVERPGWVTGSKNWLNSHQAPNQAPAQVFGTHIPKAFANRQMLLILWLVVLAIIAWDDWHNNKVLPVPSRMWSATWFFLILILVGFSDALVPLANAFGLGYTIMLAIEYFQGQMQ